ncbi:hypothetical protein [Microbacterium sp.]|uniref:hypothetical protein n=1 Tax=Microbacterium sp. TaxID=51671 RepID=UPI003A8CFC29
MSHRRSSSFRAGALALALGTALALAGCSSSGGTDEESGVIAPVIVNIGEIDGTTVEVTKGNAIDLTGDDETFTDWTAEIADEKIVEFTPGKDDGSAQFNPGLTALEVGETEVTLDNSSSDESVTFTVEVTAPAN